MPVVVAFTLSGFVVKAFGKKEKSGERAGKVTLPESWDMTKEQRFNLILYALVALPIALIVTYFIV